MGISLICETEFRENTSVLRSASLPLVADGGYGSHGRVTVKPSTAASCRSNRGRERGEGVGRRMATVQCTKCTAERKGFRRELDSWRHRLIHCVGMIHVQVIFCQKSASFKEIFARLQRDRCPELSQIAS